MLNNTAIFTESLAEVQPNAHRLRQSRLAGPLSMRKTEDGDWDPPRMANYSNLRTTQTDTHSRAQLIRLHFGFNDDYDLR